MESVEICKKEIDKSLENLKWIAKLMKNDINFGVHLYIINAIEIINIFTDILIQHIQKGNK
jgi:hypothetical protein